MFRAAFLKRRTSTPASSLLYTSTLNIFPIPAEGQYPFSIMLPPPKARFVKSTGNGFPVKRNPYYALDLSGSSRVTVGLVAASLNNTFHAANASQFRWRTFSW
ncbi:hypothetical protein ILYODFUR_015811 [Ilyodon furcidens]|uniref:Uncharacterized protein n=1 Tax=Ilyodon furcidens TaxID=33524 RepID=A0ABV0USN5_9TELE